MFAHPRVAPTQCSELPTHLRRWGGSVIIHDFTGKSTFFLLLGVGRLKRRILVAMVGLCASLNFLSCGYRSPSTNASGLRNRVLASQGITTTLTFGQLVIINGQNDTLPQVGGLNGGPSPGLIALSPTRNIAASVDSSANAVYASDTTKESSIGRQMNLPGPTSSIVVPTSSPTVYAAVPTATVNGFSFIGAVDVLNFATGQFSTIAATNARTVVSNSTGTQLLVFATDSDSVTVLFPGAAVPPVDTSCLTNPPNAVCTIVQDPSFSRPVNAIVNGNTAYILNCGFECGGTINGQPAPASVAVFDLTTLTVTQSIPVDAATMALLSGSTLYVAGTPPTNNDCTGQMWGTPPQATAATICGRLDVVDLSSGTVTGVAKITDGYHDRMDLTTNGQVFVGSRNCTNIGNVNNPSGEVRGCLSIYKTADSSVIIPPDNGDVNGLQGFTTRNIEYVAEGGELRVYDTTKDILLINDFVPEGTINIVGYVGDVKAIDFF